MTSTAKLNYDMRKNTCGCEYVVGRKECMLDADHVHCFSAYNYFMPNYAGQQISHYHTDHTHKSHLVGLFCDTD